VQDTCLGDTDTGAVTTKRLHSIFLGRGLRKKLQASSEVFFKCGDETPKSAGK
jgi:hypothetical protein